MVSSSSAYDLIKRTPTSVCIRENHKPILELCIRSQGRIQVFNEKKITWNKIGVHSSCVSQFI